MSTYKGFTSVELRKPKRSHFGLEHEKRVSTRMGKLVPILITETLPNDTFRMKTEVLLRLAPLLAPIMHRVYVFVHFFFIPNRIIWKDWEKFITAGRLGTDVPVPPKFSISGALTQAQSFLNKGSLADYLGIPPIPDGDNLLWTGRDLDIMPFAAVYKAWYDYYRDRNYVADNDYLPISGALTQPQINAMLTMKNRAWQHDYFTSALPWTQRGAEVLMPIEGTGSVTYSPSSGVRYTSGGALVNTNTYLGNLASQPGTLMGSKTALGDGTAVRIENIASVNITNSDISINDLRRAVRLQEWMERNALAGSRYNESILAHFGRKTSDGRLQRAEYLGGGKLTVKINEVVTTAYSEDAESQVVPPANMAGHGMVLSETGHVSYNCEEHGFVVGMLSVMPTSGYMQGLPRMFQQRNTFLDYPWPSFAHLGEQPVLNNEIYMTPTSTPADRNTQPIFGYQSRYSDWKHINSSVHGDFRTTLDYWHLSRKFSSQPVLGEAFVTFEDALQNRIFAVENVDTLWFYLYNDVSVKRSLPYFGTPML